MKGIGTRLTGVASWFTTKSNRAIVQMEFLGGQCGPARRYLEALSRTGNLLPVPGRLGEVRGFSSQTVVADLDLAPTPSEKSPWRDGKLVIKFEIFPNQISAERLAAEARNEMFARKYIDEYMPATLRLIGHGIDCVPSALVYQRRVPGRMLRDISWDEICSNTALQSNIVAFCDQVILMARETGRIPDVAGTLPRVDHLGNFFWNSRNIVADTGSGGVWLVDTGWKDGQELLHTGPLRQRLRTWLRLYTLSFFRWRLVRSLARQTKTKQV